MPTHRIIKEKRASFAQSPESLDFWAKTTTSYGNLFIAGDWTDSGLPAMIEGEVRSGIKAAKAVERA